MSRSSHCWRQSTVRFSPTPSVTWPGRHPSTSKPAKSWGLTGTQRRPLVTTAEGADPWHFHTAQRPPQKILKRFTNGKETGGSPLWLLFLSEVMGICSVEVPEVVCFRNTCWAWSCEFCLNVLTSWRSVCPLNVPCCSDILKIKECIFWSGITLREGRWARVKNLHLRPRGGGKEFIKEHAHPSSDSFGSTSERAEEFSSALTWVRNACQQHVWAQRTRHTDQTSKSPWPSGWTWRRKRKTRKLWASVLMV